MAELELIGLADDGVERVREELAEVRGVALEEVAVHAEERVLDLCGGGVSAIGAGERRRGRGTYA